MLCHNLKEPIPSLKPNNIQLNVVRPDETKPDVPKLDTVKPEEVKPYTVQPDAVTLAETKPAVVTSSENPAAATPETPTIALQSENNIVELLPHRATYSITLDKNYYDEDVADAKGEMTIQLAKAGDGWAIEQKSTLHIYYKDESAEQVITSLATYESLDGLKYSFNARTLRGEEEEIISGDAISCKQG